jgi:ribosomal protein S18 acetylase RimI-like enzyme
MSEIEVRFARPDEAESVARLHLAASQVLHAGLVPETHWLETPLARRTTFWREAIEFGEPQVMLALRGRTLVGFVGFDRSRDPKSRNTTGELWALYVDPQHIGQGVGLALWDAAREGLIEEDCTEVTVWVPMRAQHSLQFFDAAGFKREINTARTVPVGSVKVEEMRLRRPLAGS